MNINWWKTELTEKEEKAASEAVRNKSLSNGRISEKFEEAFSEMIGVKHAVTAPSGTAALVMSLLAHSIMPGDEVIVPANTWISTAHAPLLLGAKPVLVDVFKERPLIDHSLIESKITEKTKAIIPVHLNGMGANLDDILKIAERYSLVVIEDACQALFSKNKNGYLGTQSNAGCYSFGVTKLMTTGLGGMVVTNDLQTFKQLNLIKNNGMEDINAPHYVRSGANFKFSDILASIGLSQLDVVEEYAKRVKEIFLKYRDSLNSSHVQLITSDIEGGELPVYTEALTGNRQRLLASLKTKNIDLRVLPPSLENAPQFACEENFPNAEMFGSKGFYLASGPGQSDKEIDFVISKINSFEIGDS